MNTLADFKPEPKPGDWFFVTSSERSYTKIVVTINEHGHLIQDTGHSSGKGNYFNPVKISKEEAREFLRKNIPKFEKNPRKTSTDEVLIRCMKRFYRDFFDEVLMGDNKTIPLR
ncbi:MAG: prefoldin domain-containing protein [Candidatus Paceibacterota bacterium]|jgi:hypothetical protein